MEDRPGQVSSFVEAFDFANGSARPRSGRIYQLMGPPGSDSDADYTWNRWKSICGITKSKDVTAEVLRQIPAQQARD